MTFILKNILQEFLQNLLAPSEVTNKAVADRRPSRKRIIKTIMESKIHVEKQNLSKMSEKGIFM